MNLKLLLYCSLNQQFFLAEICTYTFLIPTQLPRVTRKALIFANGISIGDSTGLPNKKPWTHIVHVNVLLDIFMQNFHAACS